MFRHLAKHCLVHYEPYQAVALTELGEKVALEVIRPHRLIELYLVESLGYGWEAVHAEAERLEHYISEEFEETIDRLLGYPAFDPHGDPIPRRDGTIHQMSLETLASQAEGTSLVISRVSDEDPALLCYLAERNIRPGAEARLLSREAFGGSLFLLVGGCEERVSPDAAQHVFVEVAARSSS